MLTLKQHHQQKSTLLINDRRDFFPDYFSVAFVLFRSNKRGQSQLPIKWLKSEQKNRSKKIDSLLFLIVVTIMDISIHNNGPRIQYEFPLIAKF